MSHLQKIGLMMTFRLFLVLLICFNISSVAQDKCQTVEYRQQLLKDPAIFEKVIKAEKFPSKTIKEIPSTANGSRQPQLPVIKIPVVVHILYNNDAQNLNTALIKSQIDILNKDFRNKNEVSWLPEAFAEIAADCYIEFQLATIDPFGMPTTGIVRKYTAIQVFTYDDRIKNSSIGGDDAWDAGSYLNIWVGSLAGGLTGYSSPLGGPPERDGVVVSYKAFGNSGIGNTGYGRTATHEIGHWLGLQHIWGDSYCGDDNIDDTPPQQAATRGCPSGIVSSCNNSGNMYMNFMDFTNDQCTNMFTLGQADRMRSTFAAGSARNSILFSTALSGPVIEEKDEEAIIPSVISFYPNPVKSIVNFQLSPETDLSGQSIILYNNLGQRVHQVVMSKGLVQMDLTRFREGLYYVSIGNQRKMLKLIKR